MTAGYPLSLEAPPDVGQLIALPRLVWRGQSSSWVNRRGQSWPTQLMRPVAVASASFGALLRPGVEFKARAVVCSSRSETPAHSVRTSPWQRGSFSLENYVPFAFGSAGIITRCRLQIKIDEVAFRHELLQLQCRSNSSMLLLCSGYPCGGNVSVR